MKKEEEAKPSKAALAKARAKSKKRPTADNLSPKLEEVGFYGATIDLCRTSTPDGKMELMGQVRIQSGFKTAGMSVKSTMTGDESATEFLERLLDMANKKARARNAEDAYKPGWRS